MQIYKIEEIGTFNAIDIVVIAENKKNAIQMIKKEMDELQDYEDHSYLNEDHLVTVDFSIEQILLVSDYDRDD